MQREMGRCLWGRHLNVKNELVERLDGIVLKKNMFQMWESRGNVCRRVEKYNYLFE